MDYWDKWIEVIQHPLGLAGFALFLVFIFLPKMSQKKNPPWLPKAAYTMALVALLSGIGLAFWQSQTKESSDVPKAPTTTTAPAVPPTRTELETSGDKSPAVSHIEGDVKIDIGGGNKDQPAAKSEQSKKESKKSSPQSAPTPTTDSIPQNPSVQIKQETHGDKSPAVSDVEGDVIIKIE